MGHVSPSTLQQDELQQGTQQVLNAHLSRRGEGGGLREKVGFLEADNRDSLGPIWMLTLVCSRPAAPKELRVRGKHLCGHFQMRWTGADGEGRVARTASGPGEIRAPGLPLPPGLTPPGGTELLPASVLWRMAPICVPVCGAGVGGALGAAQG